MRLPANEADWTQAHYHAAIEASVELAAAHDALITVIGPMLHVWSEFPSAVTAGGLRAAVAANPDLAEDLAGVDAAWQRLADAQAAAIDLGIMSEQERVVEVLPDGDLAIRIPAQDAPS